MLILQRREGESLVIGDQITLTILSVYAKGKVEIGINAPRDILILRSELQQAISVNQDAAAAEPFGSGMVAALEEALKEPPHGG